MKQIKQDFIWKTWVCLGWGQTVEIQLFQNMVMLHIKLKGMKNAVIYNHIFCPYTPWIPGIGSNIFFLKVVMLHIKLKGK